MLWQRARSLKSVCILAFRHPDYPESVHFHQLHPCLYRDLRSTGHHSRRGPVLDVD
jgi:hypothetical protein